ncbi:MAG: UDP-glucose/GDP-mannose dehydrogenase family protein [Burkholderiaceae bacterium]|nr:MAG: UDP-glucose/GDP-mannose dehydrogenase family protein [Burkholderiaceae bacterium]
MNITIIGSGYVGLVTGACLADVGNNVLCLDVDQRKIDILNSGGIPIYEPGLKEVVTRNRAEGRLRFTTDVAASVAHGQIQFIAVGTPPDEDGSADLQYVLAAARNIATHMQSSKIVIDKSTVPVGTADKVHAEIAKTLKQRDANIPFSVLSNPEFLKEGAAVEDFMRPDRIVIGLPASPQQEEVKEAMRALYAPFQRNHERMLFMDVRSAELTKYAANAMLATRISFMNELANLAEILGADIEMVRQGIGSDPRIGYHFLYPGVGYGGSCFPKDVQALIRTAAENNYPLHVMQAVEVANNLQKLRIAHKVTKRFGDDLTGKHFAIWGLAFKPNTDDMREASSRYIIRDLLQKGATLALHDPVAMEEAQRCLALDLEDMPGWEERVQFCDDAHTALHAADALLILTEWKAFRSPDMDALKTALRQPIIFDGRNLYDPAWMRKLGFEYEGIGRK